jgi:hypothetical protein
MHDHAIPRHFPEVNDGTTIAPISLSDLRSDLRDQEQPACQPLLPGEIERRARAVLHAASLGRPPGAPRWYPTGAYLAPIRDLAATIPLDVLLDHARGAAALVAAGREDLRWWTPGSVFGARSFGRWAGAIAAHRAEIDRAAVARAELARAEARPRECSSKIRTKKISELASRAAAQLGFDWEPPT